MIFTSWGKMLLGRVTIWLKTPWQEKDTSCPEDKCHKRKLGNTEITWVTILPFLPTAA